ncbi:MAG: tryptophan synthase subunit alpha, partial [Planctomycetales bacterium]
MIRLMSAIDQLFANLKSNREKAFMPFLTAGDPDLDFTALLLKKIVQSGGHLCELGVPYSDPVADGPVIQASYTRALQHKISVSDIFEMLQQTTPDLTSPVVTMVSYAIVYRYGLTQYVQGAKASGVEGLIVPDLPVEESGILREICQQEDVSLIQLVTPNTPQDRAIRIAEASTGFVYFVSVVGITGERQELPQELVDKVHWLRGQTDLPICIGFGISQPDHIRMLAPVADGLIVGSAIVRRVASCASGSREAVLEEVGDYVASLLAALKSASNC